MPVTNPESNAAISHYMGTPRSTSEVGIVLDEPELDEIFDDSLSECTMTSSKAARKISKLAEDLLEADGWISREKFAMLSYAAKG